MEQKKIYKEKVSYKEFLFMTERFHDREKEICPDRTVRLHLQPEFLGNKIECKVNWAAIGETEPAKAVEFANQLIEMATLANEVRYFFSVYEIDWTKK